MLLFNILVTFCVKITRFQKIKALFEGCGGSFLRSRSNFLLSQLNFFRSGPPQRSTEIFQEKTKIKIKTFTFIFVKSLFRSAGQFLMIAGDSFP